MQVPGAFVHPFSSPARSSFVEIVRGEGATLWTADGRELIDGMASLWYCAAGHGRAELADAVADQIRQIAAYSCFEPFTTGPSDALAERVAALAPVPDARVFFCGSGSEAVDTAIKLSRLAQRLRGHPERTLVISRARGYHGANLGGTSAQGIALNREGWGPLVPEVVQVPSDDVEALSVLMADHADRVAAVITEPVQGAGGVFPPVDGYLAEVRALCDRHGALMVLDEVITAFGRLGTWFGAEYFGVVPDMITFAKAVTSGYQPVGGVVIGRAVRDPLEADPSFILRHGYTYSGHAAGCAAGLANLDLLEREALLDRVVPMGARLAEGLGAIAADGGIDHVRGLGGVWAIGLRPDQSALAIRDRMLELGVVTRAIGADTCTFCPPLVTTDAQIDRIVDVVATAVTNA
jgi:adenosylmethionine-8-amino-7-oxononanoate aminotransferase